MGQDLIITTIENDHARMVIARLISQKQYLSLQRSLQIVNNPPFIYLINVSNEEIRATISQLSSLGITFKSIETSFIKEEKPAQIPVQNLKANFEKHSPPLFFHVNELPTNHLRTLDEEKPKKKKSHFNLLSASILFALISLPILLAGLSYVKKPSKFLSHYNDEFESTSFNKDTKSDKSIKNISSNKNADEQLKNIKKSNAFFDSAVVNSNDFDKVIKFFQLAISFNKYNYKAWYGLIDVLYSAERFSDAHKTEMEMKNLFGDAILTLNKVIEPYGTLINAQQKEDSSYSIEYQSKGQTKKALMNESYQIIKALKPNCNCESISLFASQTAGSGMIVHIRKDAYFATLSEFEKAASIIYLE